jgi:hypothetical protein
MADDVRKIKDALLGDEKFGQKGLIAVIAAHGEQIASLNRRQRQLENWRWYAVGFVAAVGVLLPFLRK